MDKVKSLCGTLVAMGHHTMPLAIEAIDQYDELLAYVGWLERMLVSGARDQMMQHKPEFLHRDAVLLTQNQEKE